MGTHANAEQRAAEESLQCEHIILFLNKCTKALLTPLVECEIYILSVVGPLLEFCALLASILASHSTHCIP